MVNVFIDNPLSSNQFKQYLVTLHIVVYWRHFYLKLKVVNLEITFVKQVQCLMKYQGSIRVQTEIIWLA